MSAPPPVVLEVLRGSTSPARPEGGGRTVYVVTKEDVYETMFGDGEYQHFSSAYWNKDEADADVADRNEAEQRTAEEKKKSSSIVYTGHRFRVLPVEIVVGEGGFVQVATKSLPAHDRTITAEAIVGGLGGRERPTV